MSINCLYSQQNKASQIFKKAVDAVVLIETPKGFGSGFVVSRDGWIVTNHHVIANDYDAPYSPYYVNVSKKNGTSFKVTQVISFQNSQSIDIALIKVDGYQYDILPIYEFYGVEVGDEVFFIASSEDVLTVMSSMRRLDRLNKRIMIAGGGNIGYRLAGALEGEYQVKIIEFNAERAQYISEKLNSTTVLQGNASDKDLLLSENIEHMDVFCALTNDDEANIMSALLAKRMGAKQVVALVTRSAYIELIEGGAIDIAISPQQAIIGSILTHLRKGDIVNVYSLRRGAAEALEIIAHGDEKTSKVVGKKTEDLNLPPGATIAAIIRGERVIIDVAGISIEPGDHTIILVADKKHIHDVEKLFQVSVGYFK